MGAPEDLAAFCDRVHPRLGRALWLYCGDADLAAELAQETLYLVCKRWDRVGAARSPEAYAHRMAMNVANSRFRRRKAARRATERAAGHAELVATDADGADAVAVRRAIAELPPRQREAIVLRYYADLPLAEIADQLGTTVGSVKSRLHRATTALEAALGDPPRPSRRRTEEAHRA